MRHRQSSNCYHKELHLLLRCALFVLGSPVLLSAQGSNLDVIRSMSCAENLFIQNMGQIADQHGIPNRDVRYLLSRSGLNVQLKPNSFSYDSYDFKLNVNSFMLHRVDVEFVGSNPSPTIEAYEESMDYLNYYTNVTEITHPQDGVTCVYGYGRVVYRDVWPGIDLEWFIDRHGNPEYQFVIQPWGDIASIRLRYVGASKTEIAGNKIVTAVEHGYITESIPSSYYSTTKIAVNVDYVQLDDNEFGFQLRERDIALSGMDRLIIDPVPQRSWGTFYGGANLDWSYDVAVTSAADIFIAGRSESVGAIATTGAHQVALSGVSDAIAVKFNTSGVRQWGTYVGGTGVELGEGIAVTPAGDCILTGVTSSANGIATAGSHQVNIGGAQDAFFMKLSGAGVRQWASYYGGSANDYGYKVSIGTNGDFAIVGNTVSTNQISTAGSHQPTKSTDMDGFVARFSNTGVRKWATYFGGNGQDISHELVVNSSGSVIVSGYTSSATGIASTGGHQIAYGGGTYDGFIAKLDSNGTLEWGTYYGGPGEDLSWEVNVNSLDEIIVEGRSTSTSGIATPGAYQQTNAGSLDAFLLKLSSAGARQWCTYMGGTGSDFPEGTTVMYGDEIIMCGSTNSATGIATADAYQLTNGGGYDAYIAKFDNDGVLKWATYYGGAGAEYGGDVADATNGNIVLVGRTKSTNAIASAGAHQTVLGGDYDAIIVKFTGASSVVSPTITGSEHRTHWVSDTLALSNDTASINLIAPHGKVNELPSEAGTLALTTYSGYSTGSIVLYSGTSIPSGFLRCDGENVSRTTYKNLFDLIGVKYGSGDGTNTFALPNLSHAVLNYAIRYE
jgi:hypothetical protein